jgi:diguanylate cyclase (GGDEF)-like protein
MRGDRFSLDRVLLGAYVVCFAITVAMLPLVGALEEPELIIALGLQVLIGVLLAVGSRLPVAQHTLPRVLLVVAYIASVVMLRDAAGPMAGFGVLVLLPVAWSALKGRRVEFAVSVAGVALVYILPAIVIGPPEFPNGSWRAGLLFAVIAAVLGLCVLHLVERVDELMARLHGLARTDELTGLPNRRAWQELLERELSIAHRTRHPLLVVLFDLDSFKQYNDTHGHLAGDRLLRRASQAWCRVLRDTDVLARWGGDEFGLLLPDCDARGGHDLLGRMRLAVPGVEFSAGLVPWDFQSPADEVLAAADADLYRVKNAGGDRSQAPVTATP